MKDWSLDDIPWHAFQADKVDPQLLGAVKAAALVEHNGRDYETYLHNVFHNEPDFCDTVTKWAAEEVRHGEALGRWAGLADPEFDFTACFGRFRSGYQLPLKASDSVRGSQAGELVARCVVESGTSSFYSAMRHAADEPVLQEICRLIAADEFRHYKLFYDGLMRYVRSGEIGRARRIMIALSRVIESEDEELAYAYHCGNKLPEPFDRRACSRAYARRAYRLYRFGHLRQGLGMTLKAAGLKPYGRIGTALSRLSWRFMQFRIRMLDRVAA